MKRIEFGVKLFQSFAVNRLQSFKGIINGLGPYKNTRRGEPVFLKDERYYWKLVLDVEDEAHRYHNSTVSQRSI